MLSAAEDIKIRYVMNSVWQRALSICCRGTQHCWTRISRFSLTIGCVKMLQGAISRGAHGRAAA